MNLVAAILILSASGSAERSMETDASIGRIVASVAWGAVSDVLAGSTESGGRGLKNLAGLEASGMRLAIDGQPRTGLRSWAEAAWRVGGYVTDRQHRGSMEYRYQLAIEGYAVVRRTKISDGCVTLTTDARWTEVVPVGRKTKRIPIHVQITIRADETDLQPTRIVGTATGTADTREFRCGLVRRLAERQAAEQLDAGLRDALAAVEREGRSFYAGGSDIAGILDGIRFGIRTGVLRR